jgi:hypothetical protein
MIGYIHSIRKNLFNLFFANLKKIRIMSLIHSSGFAYAKNLIIGLGASIVLVGALFKILSWPFADQMLTVGLLTEAGLFVMLGVLPPHKDYYWEKLYPGLEKHGGEIPNGSNFDGNAMTSALDKVSSAIGTIKLDTRGLESQQEKMIGELQTMAKSMSSLKALQEADFTEIKTLTQGAGKFAAALNEAVSSISESLNDTKVYKEQLQQVNQNLQKMNGVYGNVLAAMGQK